MEKKKTTVSLAQPPKDKLDSALGCVAGAFCGDAVGAFLEFSTIPINESSVATALTLPGGGAHKIASGQITDDSELAICLLQALKEVSSMDDHRVVVREGEARVQEDREMVCDVDWI